MSDYPWMRPTPETMTRWEALGRLWQVKASFDRADLLGIIHATGLPLDLAADMELVDILDAISVRVADLSRAAGADLPRPDA